MSARETAVSQVLMCPPDHFAVDYVINPWMAGNLGRLDLGRAAEQWAALRDLLAKRVTVHELTPQPGLPDMVFTANAGISIGRRAIASHFMPMERRGEEAYFKHWFRSQGFELTELPDDVGFEGQGDCLRDSSGDWLWTSAGPRTETTAYRHLEDSFQRELVVLKLTDPRFYHIDTCLTPLSRGWLMYYPGAFDGPSIAAIEARVPTTRRIVVSEDDAGQFACNAVNLGDEIFLHAVSASLRGELQRAGFRVHETPLDEFMKAGGSAKCLTLKLYELQDRLPLLA